jgi:hypothetical protein
MLSHLSLSLHAMVMTWHRVQQTPSTSIHQIQHTPSTASTYVGWPFLQSHDYGLTPTCNFSVWCVFQHNPPPAASSARQLKPKLIISHSQCCKLRNWWTVSWYPAHPQLTASKFLSNLAETQPPSVSPIFLDHGLQVCMIMAFQVHLPTRSIMASKFARSCPPSASPNSLNPSLGVHLYVPPITETTVSRLSPSSLPHHGVPRASPNSLSQYIWVCTIMSSMFISEITQSRPSTASLSLLDCHHWAHLEMLSNTTWSLSRYTVCRWVAV